MSWVDLIDGTRREAYLALDKLSQEMWGIPETTGEIPPLDQRISLSLTKVPNHGLVPCIHVDRKDSTAYQRAESILGKYPFVTARLGGGEAQAAYPETKAAQKHAVSGRLNPGAAVSHGRYRFGTLGCIVEAKIDDVLCKCAVTAAHVVSLNTVVEIGDRIYCPGKGSLKRPLQRNDAFGELAAAIELFPLNPKSRHQADDSEDISVDADIALVRITDEGVRRLPLDSSVPDPKAPDTKHIKITDVLPEERLTNALTDEVYLFGAVSGFSSGILTDVGITRKVLRLPNRKNYIYHDLLGIAPRDGGAFSQPGDSGAMIYTKEGLCLGFLVGADNQISFACIGARALAAFDARIV